MPTHRHSKRPRPLDTLDPKQAAQLLKVLPGSLNFQARKGQIAVVKVGKLNRYPAEEVKRLIWARNTKAAAEKLIVQLEEMVAANNEHIAKEAKRGRHD